ncbi:SPFH domain-containing protein [Vulcanisaeta sp. JCM 14467]|uniref:SPFH domain-containing protein n=1 Tax=Vulcanisaeta sp. JCM 14467 TaxID=1295370 RepID=UPI000A405ACB|nr:SPFH domain-containing protein [Vulcanisaeta sp. JCM 14467]
MRYQVAYYFMITDPVKFINAVQFSSFKYTVEDFKNYVSPIVDQAVSQVLNLVSLNEVYANLHKVTDAVTASLRSFLEEVGVHLITCRIVRLEPEDETMRRVVQFMALGLDVNTAIRARLAEIMAQRSDPAATNMMLGVPYYPIYILPTAGMPSGLQQLIVPPTQQRQQQQQGGSSQSSDFEISGG